MIIKILGSGCKKCEKLESLIKEIVEEKGIEATIEKVEDFKEILSYGVMKTPGLVIDDEVVFSGSVPKKAKIEALIK